MSIIAKWTFQHNPEFPDRFFFHLYFKFHNDYIYFCFVLFIIRKSNTISLNIFVTRCCHKIENGSNCKRWVRNVLYIVVMLIGLNVFQLLLFMRRDNKSNNVHFAWNKRNTKLSTKNTRLLATLCQIVTFGLEQCFLISIFQYKSKCCAWYSKKPTKK